MTDPTTFPTDPLEPDGTDPDLSQDADEEHPDDRAPTLDEQTEDLIAAEEQGRNEDYPPVP